MTQTSELCLPAAAFSCKGRGVFPSFNTRYMVETAAHLTDHVLPHLRWANKRLASSSFITLFIASAATVQTAENSGFLSAPNSRHTWSQAIEFPIRLKRVTWMCFDIRVLQLKGNVAAAAQKLGISPGHGVSKIALQSRLKAIHFESKPRIICARNSCD